VAVTIAPADAAEDKKEKSAKPKEPAAKETTKETKSKPAPIPDLLEPKESKGPIEIMDFPRTDRKPVVVIDPGHGGVDPGAKGPSGVWEKQITLGYAKALREALLKTGRYNVVLTRDDDRFILLRQRVELARKAGGAVFVSLHADAAPEASLRGLSVYTLSEKASDVEAEALAARENKADVVAGMDLTHESNDVAGILISLAQRESMNKSALLADQLVMHIAGKSPLLRNTHRFAGFAVLKAPDIPSVLVEIGFLTNAKDEKRIQTKSNRDALVQGMVRGIDAYFKAVQKGMKP